MLDACLATVPDRIYQNFLDQADLRDSYTEADLEADWADAERRMEAELEAELRGAEQRMNEWFGGTDG